MLASCEKTKKGIPIIFDYIVVGSGAAGSVIANRLSEDPSLTVVVIEAGSNPDVESIVPQFFPFVNNSNIWDYNAEVVDSSANAFKHGCPCSFDKQLGGSTTMSSMLYVCGNDRDYDSWASKGNPGWSYDDILSYIKKSENNLDRNIVADGKYHGTKGYLKVSSSSNDNDYIPVLRAGFNQMGYKNISDYNSRTYNGFATLQHTIFQGEKQSAYMSFLATAKCRPNLYFMKNSEVTKILFNDLTATGVNIKTNYVDCPNVVVSAKREVIIAAGAYGSQKILMQSGIGKAVDLDAVGIKQIKELSVGDNYQDHPIAVHFIKTNPEAPKQTILDSFIYSLQYNGLDGFAKPRTGPYAELGITHANGFIDTLDTNGFYPDVQYIFYRFAKSQGDFSETLANFAFKDEYITQLSAINDEYEIVMVQTNILHPNATGTVKLRSNNPNDPLKIISNLLNNPVDVATLLRGVSKLEELIATDSLRKTSAELIKFDIPECNDLLYPSEVYWKCYFKYFTANSGNPIGTCKMGPSNDKDAVVDPTLKVHGIKNLRVADASVMPSIPAGNTHSRCH